MQIFTAQEKEINEIARNSHVPVPENEFVLFF